MLEAVAVDKEAVDDLIDASLAEMVQTALSRVDQFAAFVVGRSLQAHRAACQWS